MMTGSWVAHNVLTDDQCSGPLIAVCTRNLRDAIVRCFDKKIEKKKKHGKKT